METLRENCHEPYMQSLVKEKIEGLGRGTQPHNTEALELYFDQFMLSGGR